MVKQSHSTRAVSPISQAEFHELAQPLIGLPITRPWLGYGSALFLELGKLRKVPPFVGAGGKVFHEKPQGRASVMVEFGWRMERRSSIELSFDSSPRRIQNAVRKLRGKRLASISLLGRIAEVSLELTEGLWIQTFGYIGTKPDWCIFLPDGSWLSVKRGRLVHDRTKQIPGCRHRADVALQNARQPD